MSSPSPLPRSYPPPTLDILPFSSSLLHLASTFPLKMFVISQVPIVKLIHQQCQIEADLSLYNVLARENTCLLSLYSGHLIWWKWLLLFVQVIDEDLCKDKWKNLMFLLSDLDPRVRTLGYMVKLFAKVGYLYFVALFSCFWIFSDIFTCILGLWHWRRQ